MTKAPAPVRLSPLVRRITAPNPSMMTGAGTNTYIVGVDEIAVIDPGPDDPRHIEDIAAALGSARLRWVLLTHSHSDHAPGVPGLCRQTGALIRALSHGEVLAAGAFTLEAIHTPGHASDHYCFFLREERALFSGDLIMSGSTVVIAPPDGDMADYIQSLERVRGWNPLRIYPGHGDVIHTPLTVIEEYIQHRRMREEQVLNVLRDGPRRIAELVPQIYADVPQVLHGMAALSIYAHLLKLRAEGKVSGTDRESSWKLGDHSDAG